MSRIRFCSLTGQFYGAGASVTSFEVQQKPAVAEVEMGVVSVLLHQLKELRVQNLLGWKQADAAVCVCVCICVFLITRRLTWMRERMLAK